MCAKGGVECCMSGACVSLCDAASECVDVDYAPQRDMLLMRADLIERLVDLWKNGFASLNPSLERYRFGGSKPISLETLTAKQVEAIALMFNASGESVSYRQLAEKLGINKRAAWERVSYAMMKLQKRNEQYHVLNGKHSTISHR